MEKRGRCKGREKHGGVGERGEGGEKQKKKKEEGKENEEGRGRLHIE